MSLHRVEVCSHVTGDGLLTYELEGEPVTVNGTAMVMLPAGVCVAADRFYESVGEAKRRAADEIDVMRDKLAAQAARLREEANQT